MDIKKLFKKAEEIKDKAEELSDTFGSDEIKKLVKGFIESKKSGAELEDTTDLFKNGYVNSLFALEIVTFVEKTFKIKLGRQDISKENFATVNDIAQLVERLLKK